jgi:hypothetical protein
MIDTYIYQIFKDFLVRNTLVKYSSIYFHTQL